MNRRIFIALMATPLFTGCSTLQSAFQSGGGAANAKAETDPAVIRLAEAAEAIRKDIERLRMYDYARHPVRVTSRPDPRGSVFAKRISLDWEGPAEPVLRTIAHKIGASFRVSGNPPASVLTVDIKADDQPALDVLYGIGWQLGRNAGVTVDRRRRTIDLVYLPGSRGVSGKEGE